MGVPVVDGVVQELLLDLALLEGCLDVVAVVRTDDLDLVHAQGALGPGEAIVLGKVAMDCARQQDCKMSVRIQLLSCQDTVGDDVRPAVAARLRNCVSDMVSVNNLKESHSNSLQVRGQIEAKHTILEANFHTGKFSRAVSMKCESAPGRAWIIFVARTLRGWRAWVDQVVWLLLHVGPMPLIASCSMPLFVTLSFLCFPFLNEEQRQQSKSLFRHVTTLNKPLQNLTSSNDPGRFLFLAGRRLVGEWMGIGRGDEQTKEMVSNLAMSMTHVHRILRDSPPSRAVNRWPGVKLLLALPVPAGCPRPRCLESLL